jgi:hypothetical protein
VPGTARDDVHDLASLIEAMNVAPPCGFARCAGWILNQRSPWNPGRWSSCDGSGVMPGHDFYHGRGVRPSPARKRLREVPEVCVERSRRVDLEHRGLVAAGGEGMWLAVRDPRHVAGSEQQLFSSQLQAHVPVTTNQTWSISSWMWGGGPSQPASSAISITLARPPVADPATLTRLTEGPAGIDSPSFVRVTTHA